LVAQLSVSVSNYTVAIKQALETTKLAKTQILQQASTAMLAQTNASKQNVLSLLQG
jgi:flagellin-like hook-associated protein FlgL